MPRKITLALVFIFSLLVFVVLLMPAAVLVDRLPVLRPAGAPLQLSAARGPWWHAQVNWRWRQLQGQGRWSLDWQGLVPGLRLGAEGAGARLSGWLGADWGDWQVRDLRLSVPVAPIAAQVPQGNADGRVDATLMQAAFAEGRITSLQGTLQYSGGQVTWGRNGSATVPVLNGRLAMDNGQPGLTVTDPQGTLLLDATLADQRFKLRVMRAWPQLLGVSQGGSPDDVVFQMSRPLVLGRG